MKTYTITPTLAGFTASSSVKGDKSDLTDNGSLLRYYTKSASEPRMGASSSYSVGRAVRALWPENDDVNHLRSLPSYFSIQSISIYIKSTISSSGSGSNCFFYGPLYSASSGARLLSGHNSYKTVGTTNPFTLTPTVSKFLDDDGHLCQYGFGIGGTVSSMPNWLVTECVVTVVTNELENYGLYYIEGHGVYSGELTRVQSIVYERTAKTDSYGTTTGQKTSASDAVSTAKNAVKSKVNSYSYNAYSSWALSSTHYVRIGNYNIVDYDITAFYTRQSDSGTTYVYVGKANGYKYKIDYAVMQQYSLDSRLLESLVSTAILTLPTTVDTTGAATYMLCCAIDDSGTYTPIPGDTSWCGATVSFNLTSSTTTIDVDAADVINYMVRHGLTDFYIMPGWALETTETSVSATQDFSSNDTLTMTADLEESTKYIRVGYLYYYDENLGGVREAWPYYNTGSEVIRGSESTSE